MASSLEARSPLLDHELMEFAASLPPELKVRGREKKVVLRGALRGWVPDEILDAPKRGFRLPLGDWLRGELRGFARDVLLDRRAVGARMLPRGLRPRAARPPRRGRARTTRRGSGRCSCSSCGIRSSSTPRRLPSSASSTRAHPQRRARHVVVGADLLARGARPSAGVPRGERTSRSRALGQDVDATGRHEQPVHRRRRTSSGMPMIRVLTTGSSIAIASMATTGTPSAKLGRQKRSARA